MYMWQVKDIQRGKGERLVCVCVCVCVHPMQRANHFGDYYAGTEGGRDLYTGREHGCEVGVASSSSATASRRDRKGALRRTNRGHAIFVIPGIGSREEGSGYRSAEEIGACVVLCLCGGVS